MNRRAFLALLVGGTHNVPAPPDPVERLRRRVVTLESVAVGLWNEIQMTDYIAAVRQTVTNARLARLEAMMAMPTNEDGVREC